MPMTLLKNQYVVFSDGHKEGYLEARWSNRFNAFYSFDSDGNKVFSTDIVEVAHKSSKFVPTRKNCPVQIFPCGETEKAYQIEDGSNGHVGRSAKAHYKYIAKSICYIDGNNIFCPTWA